MKKLLVLLCFLPLLSFAQSDWYEIEVPTDKDLLSIYFIDVTTGFISGDSVLLKTTDGGATWDNIVLQGPLVNSFNGNRIVDMHWFSADHGIVCQSPSNGFYETFDGGDSWIGLPLANGGFCSAYSLFYFDENNGFAGGSGCFQGELIDRFDGEWSTTFLPESWDNSYHINEIEFYDSNVGYAPSSGGKLYTSTDGGITWDTIPALPNYDFTDIVIDSPTDLYMTHDGQWGVLESTNGGETWQESMPCATFFSTKLLAAHKSEDELLYFGGAEGFDLPLGGILFEKEGSICNYQQFTQIIQDINSHANATFFVGDNGMVYTNNLDIANNVEGLKESSSSIIYPNPCSRMVTIEKSSRENVQSIALFDLTGKQVYAETSTWSDPIQLVLPQLKSGLYTLQLKFKGKTEQHKLMIN